MSETENREIPPASAALVCSQCGERLPASARFCGKCGQPVAPTSAQAIDQPKDFFISYTGVDVEWAHWIARQLEAKGYTTVYQARDFHAGGIFPFQMDQAMRAAHRTIAVLSPEYLRSRYCAPEWAEAFRRDPTGEYALLVPVRVHECDLGGVFGARVYIDLVGLDDQTRSTRLLEQVRDAAGKEVPPAPPPGIDGEPVARPLVVAPMGLPLAASLIGREEVLTELMEKLRLGTTSGVFALEGMGGVGKTALAAEAVARLAENMQAFPGGAAWIACEGLEAEAGLAELWARVARALQLEQVAAQPDPQRRRALLAAALAQGQRLLLALDNIEPGLDADAVLETLAVRNRTALLLTARQRVEPHRVAAIDLTPLPSDGARLLFLERLTQAGGTLPTPAEEPALVALLETVGGLPLALELTAAYAGVQRLSLATVVHELESDGLQALAFGDTRRDPKRALLKRFERSWAAITARQQHLFAGLSLLAGTSFLREAALVLAAAVEDADASEDDDNPRADLPVLISYAMVEALPGGERLRLHPLLREYAAIKLKALSTVQQAQLGDTMVTFWLDYAEARSNYAGIDALEAEAAGLLSAMTWAHEQGRHWEVLRLGMALGTAWDVRGRREEQRRIYAWTDEAARQVGDLRAQCWAAHHQALMLSQSGRLEEALVGFQRALELARKLDSPKDERAVLHGLAALNYQTGRRSEARAGFERARLLAQQLGDLAAEREEVHGLALLEGRLVDARARYEQALALARQIGDPRAERAEIRGLALIEQKMGRFVEARAMYEQALALAKRLGEPAAERTLIHDLAVVDAETGQVAEARAGYVRARALAQKLGDLAAERQEVHGLAVLNADEGKFDEARVEYEQSLALTRQLGDPEAEREELNGLAVLDWKTDRLTEARANVVQALAISKQLGDPEAERSDVHVLAVLDHQTGHLTEARAGFERAVVLALQVGDQTSERQDVRGLALLDAQTGRLKEALEGLERVRALAREAGDQTAEFDVLLDFGVFFGQHSKPEQGQKLIGEALVVGERSSNVYHIGKAHYFLGTFDEEEGNNGEALTHYREALHCFEQVQASEAEMVRSKIQTLEILRALYGLLFAPSWSETRAVLEREQALLLTEATDQILNYIAESDPHPEKLPKYRAVRQLLLLARESGIQAAWAWFEQTFIDKEQSESADTPEAVRALRVLFNTGMSELRGVLEREQALLLTDEADQILSASIEQAQQSDDPQAQQQVRYFTVYQLLLRDARNNGIPTAWARFEQTFLTN